MLSPEIEGMMENHFWLKMAYEDLTKRYARLQRNNRKLQEKMEELEKKMESLKFTHTTKDRKAQIPLSPAAQRVLFDRHRRNRDRASLAPGSTAAPSSPTL